MKVSHNIIVHYPLGCWDGATCTAFKHQSRLVFLMLPCNTSRLGFTRYNSYWWEDLTEDGLGLCWQTQIFAVQGIHLKSFAKPGRQIQQYEIRTL